MIDADIDIVVPIRTVSELNMREHWAVTHKRRSAQRKQVALLLRQFVIPSPPLDIWLTRIAPRRLDSGNLGASFKAIQDGVADWLAIDDGDERLCWRYWQRTGDPKQYAVQIQIYSDNPKAASR